MIVPIGAMGGPKKRLQVREDLNVYSISRNKMPRSVRTLICAAAPRRSIAIKVRWTFSPCCSDGIYRHEGLPDLCFLILDILLILAILLQTR